ncbi:Aste57867_9035 [Aphanomyces stellatus]|uniref:Aste57867_9035 protein n=1 Tax=Aphanomyces stellatus TaxID=120398 RepID=A0A485KLX1_9STRA|nr:hypothetical protein As57867_008999 [Aphanomyces stellatus]VFT85919.1 Aste57867_9035 [Aphanomyces stellatus]
MQRTPRAGQGFAQGAFPPGSPLQRSNTMSPTYHSPLPTASLSPNGSLTARRESDQRRAQEAGVSLLGLAFNGGGSGHSSPMSSPMQAANPSMQHGYPHGPLFDEEPPVEGVDPLLFMQGVKEHAKYLGMDPHRDAEFLWIARESLVAPVPPGWYQVMTKEGAPYYYNDHTGDSRWEHPSDRDYMALFQEVKQKHIAGEYIDVDRIKQEFQQRQTQAAWGDDTSSSDAAYQITSDDDDGGTDYHNSAMWAGEGQHPQESEDGGDYVDEKGGTVEAAHSKGHSAHRMEDVKAKPAATGQPSEEHRELVESLYAELHECKKKLELQREHQDMVDALQQKVQEMEATLEAQVDETRDAKGKCKKLESEWSATKADLQTRTDLVRDMDENMKQLKQQLDLANGELELCKSKGAQENVDLRQEVTTLTMRLKEMEESTSTQDVEKQLKRESKLRFQWEQKYKMLEDQHQALMVQVDNANRKYEIDRHASQGDVEKYQKELEMHQIKLESELQASRDKHAEAINTLKETLSSQHADEVEALTKEHKKQRDEALAKETELVNKVQELEDEIKGQTTALTDIKTQFQTLKRDAAKVQARCKQLEAKEVESQALISTLQSELAAVKAGLADQVTKAKQDGAADALASSQAKVDAAVAEKDQLAILYAQEMKSRRQLHNKVMEMAGNIRVFCRVRPISQIELKSEESAQVVTFRPNDPQMLDLTLAEGQKHTFEFDYVFQPTSAQLDVFEQTKALVVSAMDGFNVCIFAYGQTGSGKTHTMEGPAVDRGVNFRAMEELFRVRDERMLSGNFECDMKLSILEVYNETIVDLLDDTQASGDRKALEVRMGKQGAYVENLMEVEVYSTSDVEDLMKLGHSHRSVGAHDVNEHSSRSHLVLSITITSVQKLDGKKATSKLHLIDLAGSERISKTAASGQRLKEAQHINRSLSALGDVIASLGGHSKHVPYRNSKLTFLLQESLSGNSKVLMFVNVSPVQWNASESLCSLNFAQRCRNVALGQAKSNTASTPPPKESSAVGSTSVPKPARGTAPSSSKNSNLTATEKVRVSLAPKSPKKDT